MNFSQIASRIASGFVKVTDSDAVEKMSQLEGPGWTKLQTGKHGEEEYGFSYALQRWRDLMSEPFDPEWDLLTDIVSGCTIYGNGGVHRYYVNRAGEILFSSFHSNAEFVKKAKSFGFKIH